MSNKTVFVVPAYNEEANIGATLKDIKKTYPRAELIVVNDGSMDKTSEIALEEGARVYTHVINRGLGATLATGIQAALARGADYIVTFDADLQHASKDVKLLLDPLKKGEADAAIGSRFLKKEYLEMMPFVKKFGNTMLTGVTNALAGTRVTDSQSGLRAFRREAAEKLMILCDKYEVSSEIIQELNKHKMRIKEVPIKAIYHDTKKGTNIKSGLHIFWGILLKKLGVKR